MINVSVEIFNRQSKEYALNITIRLCVVAYVFHENQIPGKEVGVLFEESVRTELKPNLMCHPFILHTKESLNEDYVIK